MKNRLKFLAVPLLAATLAGSLASCSSGGTSTAQCAYIVGNGQDDRKIHKVILPGDKIPALNNQEVHYVPCGPRNYIINDGQQKNANGEIVGDSHQVMQVWTKAAEGDPKVQMNIHLTANMTLNQDEAALRALYPLCYKYTCYSTDGGKANDANYSTPGWNALLSENFDPAIRTVGINVASSEFTRKQLDDPAQWKALANAMSDQFAAEFKRSTGVTETDFFCGSGSASGFTDNTENKKFTCGNVRFTINRVEAANENIRNADNQLAEQEAEAAQADAIIANAKKKYGENWAYFLGIQDTIEKCKSTEQVTCIVNLGGGPVAIPSS